LQNGTTALILAASTGHDGIAQLLLEAGVDKTLKDKVSVKPRVDAK
jgi:hypothetical protein